MLRGAHCWPNTSYKHPRIPCPCPAGDYDPSRPNRLIRLLPVCRCMYLHDLASQRSTVADVTMREIHSTWHACIACSIWLSSYIANPLMNRGHFRTQRQSTELWFQRFWQPNCKLSFWIPFIRSFIAYLTHDWFLHYLLSITLKIHIQSYRHSPMTIFLFKHNEQIFQMHLLSC